MRIGIANSEGWAFLHDIYNELAEQYHVRVFAPPTWRSPILRHRISLYAYKYSLKRFLNSCDVALVEWANDLLVAATQMSTSTALVTRLHRYEMFQWTDRIDWRAVNYAILDTQAMRQKLLDRTNLSPERAVVIPPIGIAPERMYLAPRPFVGNLGILCDLTPRKRVYELILAYYALLQVCPDLRLHIGGGENLRHKDYYEALLHLIRRLGVGDRIQFHGAVQDRWSWYQAMDIFVSFSYSEGMQVAPLEAAACGCYCLSHWWEGAEEVFPREQLFLTEREITNKILCYCQATNEQRRVMRAPLQQFVAERCALAAVVTQLQHILELAADEGSPLR